MSKIVHKKSAVVGKVPLTADLDYGELAINYADGFLYYKASNNTIQKIKADLASGSGLSNWQLKTSAYTAVTGDRLLANTNSGSFTITLPASPSLGDQVVFADPGDWGTNALTIARNGSTIEGLAENFVLDVKGVDATLVYDGSTWQVFSSLTIAGGGVTPNRQIFTATQDQTTFTINYLPEYIDVYLNGIKLVNGQDFTATNSTTVVLAVAANAGDIVEIVAGVWMEAGSQPITVSGDVTGNGTTALTLTLANTGVAAGTYGNATNIPQIAVDAKGRVTSVSNVAVSIPSGSLTFTGDVTGTGNTGSSTALTLANSGISAGTYTKVTVDEKGRATSGTTLIASDIPNLDASKITSGLIDAARLPSYVDDVLEYTNLAGFPVTGETAKIYVALDTNKTYRWSGSAYIEISASPGTTDSLVEGSTNLYFTDARARSAISVAQNLTYNSTTGVITGPNLSSYLTGNQTITFSGDVTGSGATSVALTLANSGVTSGTYTKVTVDAKGRVTTGASLTSADLPTYTGTISGSQVTTGTIDTARLGSGTANDTTYLRGDGTWATVSSGGTSSARVFFSTGA